MEEKLMEAIESIAKASGVAVEKKTKKVKTEIAKSKKISSKKKDNKAQ